ncbi:endolytic transglycosylase MltG [Novosphingobium mangrovi (ex Hu et al. 2023)]|uniref:Endolytic murein transglycosylase n=1 Tax=Novosphingobium mangrovi (ex Hu et al. 2023) TaxID=2930094 RepID=A0ABT0A8X9_9SPHN|nr:endolytic transglycosylase MltG [Novosphingobium mangrovi (ex Hu et al. 2023)]MCJ1959621.1 endolytic transglycosylase MltG [Novosphingobium mangrovi (ex Hu et al. 2023)]
MMSRRTYALVAALVLVAGIVMWNVVGGWFGSGPLAKDSAFVVPNGASLSAVADKLQDEGVVRSGDGFALRARLFGGGGAIKAGEFVIPAHASPSRVLAIITSDDVVRRQVMIPEGMPSIMVYERLMAQEALTGDLAVPEEGSVLPATYEIQKGDARADVLRKMQAGMRRTLAELWEKRAPDLVVKTPEEALVLASIVEKETAKAQERTVVAGLYSNRLKQGMLLQADPTIIYPITKGKPLGRRIRQSEIQAINDYNTYTMVGLPKHPICNPGRASIEAVLHPAETDALYMVADGTGGHVFASTLEAHNENVKKWFEIRRKRGEI